MKTINVGIVHEKTDRTSRVEMPRTWVEAAKRLGVTQPTLDKRRKALSPNGLKEPLTPEFFEQIRRCCEFCARRNSGGGATCTEHEYKRLLKNEPDELERRLKLLGII